MSLAIQLTKKQKYIAIPDEYDDVLLQLIISVIAAEIVEYYCWHMSSRMEIYIIDKHIDEFDAWAINIDNECFFNNTKNILMEEC